MQNVDAEKNESKFMGATHSMAVEARAAHGTVRKKDMVKHTLCAFWHCSKNIDARWPSRALIVDWGTLPCASQGCIQGTNLCVLGHVCRTTDAAVVDEYARHCFCARPPRQDGHDGFRLLGRQVSVQFNDTDGRGIAAGTSDARCFSLQQVLCHVAVPAVRLAKYLTRTRREEEGYLQRAHVVGRAALVSNHVTCWHQSIYVQPHFQKKLLRLTQRNCSMCLSHYQAVLGALWWPRRCD
jgi:hypothetical protein